VVSVILILSLISYYSNKRRLKTIREKYGEKEVQRRHPAIAVILYYSISFLVALISGMFKNGDLF
jgi:uncharacterized membrane protein YfcA